MCVCVCVSEEKEPEKTEWEKGKPVNSLENLPFIFVEQPPQSLLFFCASLRRSKAERLVVLIEINK